MRKPLTTYFIFTPITAPCQANVHHHNHHHAAIIIHSLAYPSLLPQWLKKESQSCERLPQGLTSYKSYDLTVRRHGIESTLTTRASCLVPS